MKNIVPINGEAKKKARRIDWTNPADLYAVVIASLGFSNECVRSYCPGMSDGMIGYRMKLAHSGKARKEFRDGTSPLAKQVIRNNGHMAEARVEKKIAKAYQTDSKKAA